MHERLENRIILLGLGGSYTYGINNVASDIDFLGITLNMTCDLIDLREFEQYEERKTAISDGWNRDRNLL